MATRLFKVFISSSWKAGICLYTQDIFILFFHFLFCLQSDLHLWLPKCSGLPVASRNRLFRSMPPPSDRGGANNIVCDVFRKWRMRAFPKSSFLILRTMGLPLVGPYRRSSQTIFPAFACLFTSEHTLIVIFLLLLLLFLLFLRGSCKDHAHFGMLLPMLRPFCHVTVLNCVHSTVIHLA